MGKKTTFSTKKAKKPTSGISTKDQILLRVKAGNKCSICHQDLIIDQPATKFKLRGEMCHIVGEKPTSARGIIKNQPLNERNCYSNLILLCKNHHEEIDNNEALYTIAKLHIIKTKHEQWIEETTINKPLDADELVYANLIDTIDSIFQLNNWNWFIDNAVRQLIHESFIDAADTATYLQIKTIWPKKYPKLTKAIKELLESYIKYITQYLEGADKTEFSDFFKSLSTPGNPLNNPDYFYLSDKNNLWARINFQLLSYYTVKLNQFAEIVRRTINPIFYRVKGKFIIVDSFGTHLGDWGVMLEPTIETVEKKLSHLNSKLKELEDKHKKEQQERHKRTKYK